MRDRVKPVVEKRVHIEEVSAGKPVGRYVLVCTGGGCIASGALAVKAALEKELHRAGRTRSVQVFETGCLGPCAVGPIIVLYPDGVLYENLKPEDMADVVRLHLKKGQIVDRLVHRKPVTGGPVPALRDIDFLARQTKIVLRNCGVINPLSLDEYIGRDGYQALSKVLKHLQPDDVIELIKQSGIRGRGGAGFPTWLKWSLTRKAVGTEKYVLCNGDEGDPGAFMDRSVLEGDPHSVIEAMCIAAYAIGAGRGFIYVRAEYPLAVERLQHAIDDARAAGLLGEGILGTNFAFDLEIRMGSGAFVCGEETALMTSIEGNRGEPRPRPPFPANRGLWGKPSALNNVETYAAIPAIVLNGAAWYASFGTAKSKGTKVFALAGAVNTTGLVEIPIGTPLGEIVYDIGGGIPDGKRFKAAQMGGPSGGCIPRAHLNVPVDYESLTELGAIMGSGGLIVMDEDTCMVDVARYFLDFVQDESCGKCVPCRVGTKRMLEILDRICEGKGEMADLDRLVTLGNQIKDTALCGLGQTAPNPVLSTIRHFRDEYIAHIRDKHCPAGVCPALVRAPCQNACPAGVNVPGFVSLVGEKRYAEALRLHRERNPFAAICASVCFHPCEQKCRRAKLDSSLAIRGVKRHMVEQETKPLLPEVRDNPAHAKRKIAVIGGGPAGLSCAYFLARMGFRPTIFEASGKLGGMLVQTIPSYRLPRATLDREIRMIRGMGVAVETGTALGRDFTLKQLHEKGYEAVFLGVGAPLGVRLGLKGEDVKGVLDGIQFLKDYNLNRLTKVGKHVAVIGGGNVAVDAARTALRLGAKTVTVLYRRTREEMPAWADEVDEALKEGVRFEFLVAPHEILSKDGVVTGVHCTRMELGEFDRSGRRSPRQKAGDALLVDADQVVAAIGQALDTDALVNGSALSLARGNRVEADPVTARTSLEWVFAGGDAVTGPASVIDAIAAGERGAAGIDRYLTGEDHAFWRTEREVETAFDPDAEPVATERMKARIVPVGKRRGFEEVELAPAANAAIQEARRCLRCDYRGKE
ncbi:MAG: hydrogenase [Lentisphaerae bacterium RIFOXYC12_FULL_60_16]|nr:MAG: hydrogenase [Lentisphaerae bacterium RIFOXYC12_FULL_60_16]